MKSYPKYSVLMSVYFKDNPDWLRTAIDSMLAQTVYPDEFVLIEDGKLTKDLENVVVYYEREFSSLFRITRIAKNQGLGLTLRKGVTICKNEFIARMDADDYSLPERIEKQFEIFDKHPELSVVGTLVDEFTGSLDNIVAHVALPETPEQVVNFAKKRCPARHPSLLFKRKAVIDSGNYRHCLLFEDYDLYVRMLHCGCDFFNIQFPYVKMRVNDDFYKRRSGVKYLRNIFKTKREFVKIGFISNKDFLVSFSAQTIVCLMPNGVRKFIYSKLLRKST